MRRIEYSIKRNFTKIHENRFRNFNLKKIINKNYINQQISILQAQQSELCGYVAVVVHNLGMQLTIKMTYTYQAQTEING